MKATRSPRPIAAGDDLHAAVPEHHQHADPGGDPHQRHQPAAHARQLDAVVREKSSSETGEAPHGDGLGIVRLDDVHAADVLLHGAAQLGQALPARAASAP
jgi:hypothetical protein